MTEKLESDEKAYKQIKKRMLSMQKGKRSAMRGISHPQPAYKDQIPFKPYAGLLTKRNWQRGSQ